MTRVLGQYEPGWWAMKLVKKGVEVAACIQYERTAAEPSNPDNLMDRSAILTARINGEIVPLDRVWLSRGRQIDEAEYNWLLADRAWAKKYRPNSPEANPGRKIDWKLIKI